MPPPLLASSTRKHAGQRSFSGAIPFGRAYPGPEDADQRVAVLRSGGLETVIGTQSALIFEV